ncbi:MAG: GAF domain-containing protein [Anaerolineales bacterium]|nr:GAF domain-containing protein [Anaerolineales bacterium]
MKILYVEDEVPHVELAQRTLENNLKESFVLLNCESCKSALELLKTETNIDIVLTDLRLPDGSGLDLLKSIRELPYPPAVVLVTGQGDEQVAVAALKAGAADYLVKQSDYLHRLPVVIKNAVAQNNLAREQAAKLEAEVKYQALVEQIPAVVFLDNIDDEESTIYISPRVEELTGYTPEQWHADPQIWEKNIHPDDKDRVLSHDKRTHVHGDRFQEEYRFIRRDGRVIWIKEDTNLIRDKSGNPLYWQGILIDITKDKDNEAALQRQLEELTILNAVTLAGTEETTEDRVIERFVQIVTLIYSEVCGVLLLNNERDVLIPHPSYYGADVSSWEKGTPLNQGVTGKSVLTGKAIRLDNTANEPAFIEIAPGVRSELCIPIRVDQRIIGVLNVESRKLNAFDDDDEQFLTTVAGTLGTALERLRLFNAEQQRNKELSMLYLATRSLTYSLKPEIIAQNLLETMADLIGYEVSTITLIDDETQNLIPLAVNYKGYTEEAHQAELKRLRNLNIKPDQGLVGWVIQNNLPVCEGDVLTNPLYLSLHEGMRSLLCAPLAIRGGVIGALTLESREINAYNKHDESLLTTLASSAAIALENAHLYETERVRRQDAELLREATASLSIHIEIKSCLEQILNSLMRIVSYDSASIFLEDEYGDMEIVAIRGFPEESNLIGKKLGKTEKWRELTTARKTLIMPDAQQDPRFEKWEGTEQIRGWMGIPMISQDKIVGFINLDSHRINAFTERDATIARTFANSAAVAIKNAQLFASQREQFIREAAILTLMRSAVSSLDLDKVLHIILDQLIKLLGADAGSIQLLQGDQLQIATAVGFDSRLFAVDGFVSLHDYPLNQFAIETQKAVRLDDVKQDDRYIQVRNLSETISFILIPLISKGVSIGLITLDSRKPAYFTERDVEIGVAIANHASIAIENARLYDETQRRLKEMVSINRISLAMRGTQSQSEMCNILLNEALDLLNAEHGSVWTYDASTNMLVQRSARGVAAKVKYPRIKPNEGITGHVISTGNVYITADLKNDPLFFDGNRDAILEGFAGAGIPIYSTDGILGVLMVQIESSRHVEDHVGLLTTLAEIAGNAIHRADLFEQSQDQIRKLTTLRDIDSAIASSTDLRVTLNILMDHTLRHLKVDAVDILLYHPELQSLTYMSSAGFRASSPTRPLMRIGDGLAGQVVMKGRIEQVPDLQALNEAKRDPLLMREGFTSYIGVPLIVKGQIKGVFEIFHRSPLSVNNEWMQFMQTLTGQAAIAIDNSQLFDNLQRSNQEIRQAYDTTLEGWARALELRDRETEGHTRRVTDLTMRLARHMRTSEDELVNIYRGVLLHDIGKMGVPDQILRKTGPLNDGEWVEMRRHPQYAFDLLAPIPYLRPALDIPYCHHEHWDGSGYPRGLKGEQIPLSARIFSVVDIWDALLSDRPYRNAWSREKVKKYLKNISGTVLDPRIVETFLTMIEQEENQNGMA